MAKFAPTNESVEEIISKLKSKNKQRDAWTLVELFKAISKEEPVVWYPGIIGFGYYQYTSDTGVEGESPFLAFAPRGAKISLYIDRDLVGREEILSRLGKHKEAVGCVYVNKLDDIDLAVLEEILEKSMGNIKTREKK